MRGGYGWGRDVANVADVALGPWVNDPCYTPHFLPDRCQAIKEKLFISGSVIYKVLLSVLTKHKEGIKPLKSIR